MSFDETPEIRKAKETSCKELAAWLKPESYGLDWQECAEMPDEGALHLQQSVYNLYCKDIHQALYVLGFSQPTGFSSAIHFLWSVTASYIKFLAHNADIEGTREKTEFLPDQDEVEQLVANVPSMHGYE